MYKQNSNFLKDTFRQILYMALGVLMASIGLKGFLLPNHFLDGGAMGISLLIQTLTHIDLSILIILVNLPFILIGVKQMSLAFAIRSSLAITVLAILVHFISIPVLTQDKLLIAVFGGFFLGAGIGLTIRGSAVIDGTEILAVSVSRKSSLSVGDFIGLFNVILFTIAGVLINVETALYSMLTYISASKTVDFILNGIEEYICAMIVSNKSSEIKKVISEDLGRGVTVFRSAEGFGSRGVDRSDKKVLFCVITRLEIVRLLNAINEIDESAFVVQYPIKDTKGGMIKRRPLH
ncbi:MAG: YitT family protein [Moraxellaceae bacterium]|nr:YitT family protein [Moraxellaceae bacterium]